MAAVSNRFVNVVIPPLTGEFTYEVADDTFKDVGIGYRVEVPFGRRVATGFVVSRHSRQPVAAADAKSFDVKSLVAKADHHLCFSAEQLRLFEWVADYYGDSIAQVIDVAVPAHVSRKFERTVFLSNSAQTDVRGKLQKKIIEFLKEKSGRADYSEILRNFRGATPALQALEKQAIISISSSEVLDQHLDHNQAPTWAKRDVELSKEQQSAVDAIVACSKARKFETHLLHGITGSGKTEVYIEAIREINAAGLGALVLVPEIALTPQLIDRFRARIGANIAILHSALQRRARWDSWRALLEGRSLVAIGARSGIFAPVPKLGLIVIDEEHDSSYKQSEGLRYHARDLAIVRGKLEGCPVVLGSATPSLETFHNALTKRFHYAPLKQRPKGTTSPTVEIVDLNRVKPYDMPSRNISPVLFDRLSDTLAKGEQAFLLYNRRGFASYLQCELCEAVVTCPHCSVTLTYHQHSNSLMCHYCNLSLVPGQYCTQCPAKSPGKLVHRGAGTEKIFEELQKLFPDAELDRLDRDSVDSTDSYRAILDRVRSGATKILVGTQMIAKGHDLPGVTLVGIVDCDIGLHMPDFRAGERVFQLLTQAAGRSGRGDRAGIVVLQTRVPQHPSIVYTVSHNYSDFAKLELNSRAALDYPPFGRILRIVVGSEELNLAVAALRQIREQVEQLAQKQKFRVRVLGPSPAPLQKLKTLYRAHLIIKSKSASQLNSLIRSLKGNQKWSKKLRVIFDLDPQEML